MSTNLEKAAVLGATGPTGIVIAEELNRRGLEVRVVSRSRESLRDRFGAEEAFEIVVADLLDLEQTKRAVDSCDVLFLTAGAPMSSFGDHLTMAENVLSAADSSGARPLLVSSFWSYGPTLQNPVSEDRAGTPQSEKSKIRKEQQDLFLDRGGAVTLLPDFYGPRADLGFLNPALRAVARGKTANWIGDPSRPREFIFVPDVAYPIVELASREEAFGDLWNLAGPGATSLRELLEAAADYAGRKLRIRVVKPFMLNLLAWFSSDVREIRELYDLYMTPPILDTTKLRSLIGDYPTTPYEEGIKTTIDWFRSH